MSKKYLKSQETRDKRPKMEKLKKKEITITETGKKLKLKRKEKCKEVWVSMKSVRRQM